MQKATHKLLAVLLSLVFVFPAVWAQTASEDCPKSIDLVDGTVGDPYEQNILRAIQVRDRECGLQGGSANPRFRWTIEDGLMPPGLVLRSDGTVTGVPTTYNENPYEFKVKIADELLPTAAPETLELRLRIMPARIRLARGGLRLVPTTLREAQSSSVGGGSNEEGESRTTTGASASTLSVNPSVMSAGTTPSQSNDMEILAPLIVDTATTTINIKVKNPNIRSVTVVSSRAGVAPIAADVTASGLAIIQVLQLEVGQNDFAVLGFANNQPVSVLPLSITRRSSSTAPAPPATSAATPSTPSIKLSAGMEPPITTRFINVRVEPTDPEKKIHSYYFRVTSPAVTELVHERMVRANPGSEGPRVPQTIEEVPLAVGRNRITARGIDRDGRTIEGAEHSIEVTFECNQCPLLTSTNEGTGSRYSRLILGFQQSGVSAGASEQKPFIDLFFSAPLGRHIQDVPPLLTLWGNVRFTSVPQQGVTLTNALSFASSNLTAFGGTPLNSIVQGFEFLAGADIRLLPWSRPTATSESYGPDLFMGIRQRTSLSFVLSGGAITPLTQRSDNVQFFAVPRGTDNTVNPIILSLFDGLRLEDLEGKSTIAVVTPARDRFLRQYYGGLRVRTFFYDSGNRPINRFPATLDLLIGRSEAVTGIERNPVFRVDAYTPIPYRGANFLYLFGTLITRVGGGTRTFLPVSLPIATGTPTLFDPQTLVITADRVPHLRTTRDYYQFGIGINLLDLLNRQDPPPNDRR